MSDVEFVFMEPKQKQAGMSLVEAWKIQLKLLPPQDQPRFSVVQSTLDELEPPYSHFDCIVSPANSYGIMDGGFDYYLSVALSPPKDIMALTRVAQAAIKARFYGFAPPGTCTLVPLPAVLRQNARFPHCRVLAVCPTMRTPEYVNWHRDLVYNTMWSLLTEVERWNEGASEEERIRKVAMTGLATGIGGVDKEVCARQMVIAIKHFLSARSAEGRKKWAQEDFPHWSDVFPIASEVREPGDEKKTR
ncbi:macro domain-like protein [Wolfiporia cocos MD-104 SS10]|uniref:Macro domain-like protein n=1 Tax=Wolfiporia cocos (strain MD-104) TaxID=742152 RepID=A0A2H3J638_WOLCO|nr:macro domain-like protein [Wolfiporia cocos MD-104 SS10]